MINNGDQWLYWQLWVTDYQEHESPMGPASTETWPLLCPQQLHGGLQVCAIHRTNEPTMAGIFRSLELDGNQMVILLQGLSIWAHHVRKTSSTEFFQDSLVSVLFHPLQPEKLQSFRIRTDATQFGPGFKKQLFLLFFSWKQNIAEHTRDWNTNVRLDALIKNNLLGDFLKRPWWKVEMFWMNLNVTCTKKGQKRISFLTSPSFFWDSEMLLFPFQSPLHAKRMRSWPGSEARKWTTREGYRVCFTFPLIKTQISHKRKWTKLKKTIQFRFCEICVLIRGKVKQTL